MKFNWGFKIALFYSSFVVFILFMVYMAFGQKYDLVTEDYYAQELEFQHKIDGKSRVNNLAENLKISIDQNNLNILFPKEMEGSLKGKINCFRPSDQDQDFEKEIVPDDLLQTIPLSQLKSGKYTLKLDWTSNGLDYYTEKIVIIP